MPAIITNQTNHFDQDFDSTEVAEHRTPALPVTVGYDGAIDDANLDENDDDDHHIICQPQQTQKGLRDDVNGADNVQDGHDHRQDDSQFEGHKDTPPREEFGPDVA